MMILVYDWSLDYPSLMPVVGHFLGLVGTSIHKSQQFVRDPALQFHTKLR